MGTVTLILSIILSALLCNEAMCSPISDPKPIIAPEASLISTEAVEHQNSSPSLPNIGLSNSLPNPGQAKDQDLDTAQTFGLGLLGLGLGGFYGGYYNPWGYYGGRWGAGRYPYYNYYGYNNPYSYGYYPGRYNSWYY